MQRLLAGGLSAAALIAGGCGEQASQPLSAAQSRGQLSYILSHNNPAQTGVIFTGFQPGRYRQLAEFSLTSGGVHYEDAVLSDQPVSSSPAAAEELYTKVQGQMIQAATAVTKKYVTIGLPLDDAATGRRIGTVESTLKIDHEPSLLILAKAGELSTLAARQTDAPAAVTFTNREVGFTRLKDSVSVIPQPGSSFRYTVTIATEACQAKVDVETGDANTRISAQEVICNSLGWAYAWAYRGSTYNQYVHGANANKVTMGTSDGGSIRFLVLPPAAYSQLQHNQSPTELQGLRSESGPAR